MCNTDGSKVWKRQWRLVVGLLLFVAVQKKLSLMSFRQLLYLCLLSFSLALGCYSFKGISIPPDVNTYYVSLFEDQTQQSAPTFPRDFTERLKDRIRRETRLTYSDTDPDIEFSGAITGFSVTAEAPKANEQIGFNKLTVTVRVEFINHKNEKANWRQQFSFYDYFDPAQNLLDVQDQLLENISKELVDQIFNRAFTNW